MRIAIRFSPLVVITACLVAIGVSGASGSVTGNAHCQSSRRSDAPRWVASVPAGWHVVGFSDSAGKTSAAGVQFSNVALPAPRLVTGYPIQVNDGVLPTDGVGLIIATDTDLSLSRNKVAALPLPSPSTVHDRWTVGSALAGEPYIETLWFRVACTTLIASAKIGPAASPRSLRQLASIVESLHQQPARGRLEPRDGLLTGSLSVCCDARGSTPEAGIVVIRASSGTDVVVQVDGSGHFSVSLPAGRYRIVGGIPRLGWQLGRCVAIPARSSSPPAEPAIVKAGARTNVIVSCQGQ